MAGNRILLECPMPRCGFALARFEGLPSVEACEQTIAAHMKDVHGMDQAEAIVALTGLVEMPLELANILRDSLSATGVALKALVTERARQDEEWGGPSHDDTHDAKRWLDFIDHQRDSAFVAAFHIVSSDSREEETRWIEEYRERLVKIGALSVAAIESLDRTVERMEKFAEAMDS